MLNQITRFFNSFENILYKKIQKNMPFTFNPCYALYIVFQLVTYSFFSRITYDYNFGWWTPQVWVDVYIPLVVPMVVPYVLYAPLIFLPAFLPMSKSKEKVLSLHLALASLVAYVLSFTITVSIGSRIPIFDQTEGPLLDILSFIYYHDPNGVYFPSIHVMHSLLIGFHLWEKGSPRRWILFSAIFISLSTIFVKQHFFLDAVMGVISASAIFLGTSYTARLFGIKMRARKKKSR